MADRPRDNTWWLAADGKWYPPTLEPGPSVEADPEGTDRTGSTNHSASTDVPHTLTRVLTAMLGATSIAFAGATFFSFRLARALDSPGGPVGERELAETSYLGWSSIALMGMLISGLIVVVWTFKTSKAIDARGATGRRWRGGWTIGAWLIPLASFILPKLVYNELEKAAQVPYSHVAIGESWKSRSRSTLGDIWWLLWISGLLTLQATQVLLSDPALDDETLGLLATVSVVAYALLAAAGISMILVVRRIARDAAG